MPVAGRELRLQTPRVFLPLLAETVNGHPVRYRGAFGGRGSAKSWCLAEMLIERLILNPKTRAVCVREVQRSLKHSAKQLLKDTIERLEVDHLFRIMDTEIRSKRGDGLVIFNGMSDHTADTIKSLEGFDIAWCEEAQSISRRSLTMLRPTIRKDGSEIWFSWNPNLPTDPIDEFLRGPEVPPDAIVVKSTYYDNPFLPDVLQREMEWDRRRDIDKYDHIWLGNYEKHSEARVFKNWRVDEFETPPGVLFLLGGDWGYSIDPSVLIRCYVIGRTLFIDHEVYKIGCEIDHLPQLFDGLACTKLHEHGHGECEGFARPWTIIADSQRPDTISYLKRHGYPKIQAAVKGKDSVKDGVIFLQSYDIVVHPRCTHTIDELTHYSFKKDPLTDAVTPVLEDKKNHVIDSLRYAVETMRTKKKLTAATWGSQRPR